MPKIKGRKFEAVFYKIIIFIFVILSLTFFILGQTLNKEFFVRYSPDGSLKESTIQNVYILQVFLSVIGGILLLFISVLFYFRERFIEFIGKHKEVIQNLSLFVVALLMFFLFVEISLNIMLSEKTFGPGFGPGSLKFNKKYVNLNNDNMRDRNFNINKPEGVVRIAVIGDSFTFGSGIKDVDKTYSKLIESRLNEISDKKYEVLNFGLPGKNTKAEIEILEESALKYNPDVIILGYVLNDFVNVDEKVAYSSYITVVPFFGFWLRNFFYSYAFVELKINKILESLNFKVSETQKILLEFESERNKDYNKNLFRELSEIAKKEDIEVVVVMFPSMSQFDSYPFFLIHEFVSDNSEENNFYFIDLFDFYKNYPEDSIIVSEYDKHPNEFAHEIAAEIILETLINNKIIQ
ncbi:MAG: SGNH/GDSL hydrolase family protein [Nanoarchaeota archaeon]